MTYQEMILKLGSEPTLLTPAAYSRLVAGLDLFGEEVEEETMEVVEGVAVIPVSGIIGRGISGIGGCCDTDDVMRDIEEAETRDDVKAILFDIDSPGGMVNGTPELADRIAAIAKPNAAFTAGDMDSAAYWLGCATSRIYATKSANVGSIGVYSAFTDLSRMADQMGIKVDVIASGKYKGAGVPGTSLSQEQRELLQRQVNDLADEFKVHVSANRDGLVDMDAMQGQSFAASAGLSEHLIDEIVGCKEDVIDRLKSVR